MRKLLVAGVAVAALMSGSAHAGSGMTGNELLQECTAKGYDSQGYCLGIVFGFVTGNTIEASSSICIPEHVNRGQTRDVVVRYLQQHPEKRHLQIEMLLNDALAEAFPCSQEWRRG
jgi:hypothetical protein